MASAPVTMAGSGFLAGALARVIVFDGGLGTELQRRGVKPGACNELLVETEPELVSEVHAAFLAAGAQVVETDSFGGARHVLAEHGLAGKCHELNRRAAAIARRAARRFSTARNPRYVAGSIGPGSKLPSLGQIEVEELKTSYAEQVKGLLAGGVDCLVVETCQDLLQARAALVAIEETFERARQRVPVMVQVTLDEHGRTLTGSDIETVLATLEPMPVAAVGLNCGLGPEGLSPAARYLAGHSSKLLSIMPNAGLPRLDRGRAEYDLGPEEFARQMGELALSGVNIVGGCCGTTPEHIRHMAAAVAGVKPRLPEQPQPRVSSLYQAQDCRVRPAPLIVGERTNATGSRAFRDCLLADDFDGLARAALAQEQEGAHLVDLSVAATGRSDLADMKALCSRLNRDLHVPVMVDSTRPEVVEAALARLAGRSVVNSAHLEDPDRARRIIELCRRHGAALVLLTIDEQGMAMTLKRKLAVADRLYRLAVEEGGLEPSSLFFDFLTFTLGSGEESLRDAARQTLDAVEAARARFPESLTILGVSNVSHGLAPEVRRALNSVFLARAVERGLDAAIMHAGRVLPLSELDPQVVVFCNDLISNRHGKGSLSLQRLLAACCRQDHPAAGATAGRPARAARSARARLWQAILAGNTSDGRTALEELLGRTPALQLIQEHLVPAMDEVGRLFGQGRMQLPFVLRAAETVRALLSVAAARMPPRARRSRGKLVIATVRGDVHDIGKNLVDLVVSSAGFEVVNLGVRQTAEDIITAVERHRPNAIGLSGLLVESARVMREYLETFERRGIRIPVICGGAALTNVFVAKDLKPVYTGEVCYAKDAIAGLGIMKRITSVPSVFQVSRTLGASSIFRGTKIERAGGDRLWQYVDLEAVVVKRWKLLPPGAPASQMAKAKQMADSAIRQYNKRGIWHGGYVYGIFLGRATPKALLLLHPGSEEEMSQFNLAPAELRKLARRFKNEAFHVGLQVVTIGPYVTPEAQRLVADGKVADSFFLHGVAAEMVEGLAEFCQAQMPPFPDWKKADRFSPGFPAWPALREQRKVFDVLRAERIGVQLTETWQIVPEYSASAIVLPAV